MQSMVKAALDNYNNANRGALPDKIVIYRDGVGGPSMEGKVMKVEIGGVREAINSYQAGYNPQILYVFVNKRTTHRLFLKDNGNYLNPGPGTVLDKQLVENDQDNASKTYDFYMIPHKATVATAQPVHFKVVFNTTMLSKEEVETFTFHQCYNYFNFGGGIKVPAACKYAEKLANYTHDIGAAPNDALARNLHYL